MSVSVSQSREIAFAYMRANMDFEGNCICMPKAYSEEKNGRIVEVRYREKYLVMQLLVKDCRTVEVLRDRQLIVAGIARKKFSNTESSSIDLQALHDENVENTFKALQMIREEFPDWISVINRDPENGKKGDPELAVILSGKKGKTSVVRIKMVRTKAIRARYSKRLSDKVRLRTIFLPAGEVYKSNFFKNELLRRLSTIRSHLKL